ncbi:MAG: class I SAM-dependent methyltransferase [Muribaculum sp.]|nr:class I SAM-dependent methyltransferase [Muribaculum sp.]
MTTSQDFFDFIRQHQHDDVNSLRLKYSGKVFFESGLPLELAFIQIEARRKTKKKLPTFLSYPSFIIPSLVAAEQASNEAVANFHSSFVDPSSNLLDLTAGLGIDDMSFAKAGCKVTACDIDPMKCEVLTYNSKIIGTEGNLNIICQDSLEFLNNTSQSFDIIFADPARRSYQGKRLHALAECQPDILSGMQTIMSHTDRLMVKCSPLLDLSLIINTIGNLHHIYVVCFRGECKEILIDIRNANEFTGTTAIDLDWDNVISEFHCMKPSSELRPQIHYAQLPSPMDYGYLYEPNAAIMKTGDWAALLSLFPAIRKADTNTHLFLADTLYDAFPGKRFKIICIPDKKALKELKGSQLNIVARNYPLTPQQITQKYGIISGGTRYLYAFRHMGKPTLLILSEC